MTMTLGAKMILQPNFNSQTTTTHNRFNSTFIIEVKRGNEIFTSSAVAIGRNVLLTAAHSVDCIDTAMIYTGDDYNQNAKSIEVSRWVIHPEYNPSKSLFENDLALIFINENLPIDCFIEDIFNVDLKNGEILSRIGFGARDNMNKKIQVHSEFKQTTLSKLNLVLFDSNSVVGDSGGPIYKQIMGNYQLIGLHSTLEGKDKIYVVNLGKYKQWIEMNLDLRLLA